MQRLATDAGPVHRPGPQADPKFAALKADVRGKQQVLGAHPPATAEASKAQGAAKAPQDDREAQGKAANAEKMNAAKPGEFDKAAFVRAVNEAIAAQAPKNLDEADKFGESGKADAVKGQVQGQVTDGKKASANAIETTTKAPPDTSQAKDKQVTPLVADKPPATPGTPDPAKAVPDKAPPAATDLSGGPKQVDQQMAEAQVTEEQLAKSNEPEFTGALKEKDAVEQHAATAPGQVRAAEAQTLSGAKAAAGAAGATAMTALAGDRKQAGQSVGAGKEQAKSADEAKREKVTATLQKVFDATKKDVEEILSGLDKKVDEKFSTGEKAARDAFTAEHTRLMDAYKDKRYSGLLGKGRWIKDKFAGLPEEANQIFVTARKGYVDRMQQVISGVADVIGAELTRAKQRIATGRDQLQAEVKKLPADLQAIGKEAAGEFAGKFDELTESVNSKGTELVQTLASKYNEALKSVDEEIAAEKEKNKGLVAKAVDAVAGVIKTIMQLKDMLLGVLAKAAQAVMAIIKDPIGFLGNLVSAVGAGLRQFMANIGEHLKKGLVGWLTGAMAGAGLELPAKFDLRGIVMMIGSLLGLTWASIRGLIIKRGVPEPAMGAVEKSVPLVQKVQAQGLGGLWEEIQDKVGDLKANLFSKISEYLIPTVLMAGITWIISLLNPASAFVRAVKMIIDFVTFIVTQGAQIIEFVNSVLDAIIAIAGGGTGGVPALIEKALARSVPVLIGVLAAVLGVGGIAQKVQKFFKALSKPVMKAVDWVVGKIVALGRKLWAKLKGKDKNKPGKDGGTPEQKAKTAKAASAEARSRLIAGATPDEMHGILEQVHRKYAPQGLKSLRMERAGEHQFRVSAKVNPEGESELIHLPARVKGDEHALGWTREELRVWTRAQETAKKTSNETADKLKNILENKKPKREPDPPTVARGVFKWTAYDKDDVSVVKAASSRRLKDHSEAHQVRGAHAEEHLTLYYKNTDLPDIPTDKQSVPSMSLRYEINRSPCVNCATYIADFVERDLRPRTQNLSTVVLASALYEGAVVFTGEIKQRYRRIFDELISAEAVQTFQEFEEIQKAKAAEKGKEAKELDKKKMFSGVPRTQKAMGEETTRRTAKWDKVTVPDDVRREWFRIRPMESHGMAGLAILRAHGITIKALTAAEAGVDRPLTEEENKAMTEEDQVARKLFLQVLKRKNDELLKVLARVDNAGVSEKDDSWVVNHGYVGGR
ncbi:hypothetical protein OOK41_25055 [Micromonospora sp. NBC_01655]|uniref:phage tail protein n=1 Tax=Micromonospora sp. NBC_01655 TaxID=2975983 RepID=UPI0022538BE6|nr:hypothetical protein [Micromonospora sp. NBC_01655]MCX4473534.1 hypothetical protein [Micromonospora sp. NBC_01655]